MSNPDTAQKPLEEHNREADDLLEMFQRDFPRIYRLLAGTHFQLPARRQTDYPHYGYAVYDNALTLLEATLERTSGRGDSAFWRRNAGLFTVTNEWMKRDQTTLFVEKELGEALKRTDLPEGFCPQDLHWRWTAFRLILPLGLFRVQDDQGEWDIFCVTVAKLFKGQPLDFHPALAQEARAVYGQPPLPDAYTDDGELLFGLQRRRDPNHKKSLGICDACRLDERTLRSLAEEIDVHFTSSPFWTPDLSAFLIGFKRFLFNVLLFLGSLPEEYEPDQVLRPAREKKGRFRPELRAARFLGREAYRLARRPEGKADHEPTGRKLPAHWKAGGWKRVAHGPGMSLRRLQWIQPYRTHGPDADEADA